MTIISREPSSKSFVLLRLLKRKTLLIQAALFSILSLWIIHGTRTTRKRIKDATTTITNDTPMTTTSSTTTLPTTTTTTDSSNNYIPSEIEDYIVKNAEKLGFQNEPGNHSKVCTIYNDPNASPIYDKLHTYVEELNDYSQLFHKFKLKDGIKDVRRHMNENHDICNELELDPGGLPEIFKNSGQLSYLTKSSSSSGWIEPLLPPMRHPHYCMLPKETRRTVLLDVSYLIHDFGEICRKLKPTSRTVLIDMGASLEYHKKNQPGVYLTSVYERFGIPFDHIYAYEITPTPPEKVYSLLPSHLIPSYHWINLGVNADEDSDLNPFKMLMEDSNYNEDDFIVVKLDIDTPPLEIQLAVQLSLNPKLAKLIDQFYFEHHVHIEEMIFDWKKRMLGTPKESLDLFSALRKLGIAAHFWV